MLNEDFETNIINTEAQSLKNMCLYDLKVPTGTYVDETTLMYSFNFNICNEILKECGFEKIMR